MTDPSTATELTGRTRFSVLRPLVVFWAGLWPFVQIALLLPRVQRGLAIVLAVGAVLGAALPLAVTLTMGRLVGAVPAAIAGGADSEAGRSAVGWLLLLGVLIVSMQAMFRTRGALTYSLGMRLNHYLARRVMRALNRPFGVAHLEDPEVQDLVRRTESLSGQQGYSPGVALGALTFQVGNWLLSISYVVVLAWFNVWLALVLFAVTVVVSHIQRRDYLRVTEVVVTQAGALRRADYWRDLALRPEAAKEVRVWGLGGWLTERFAREWRGVMEPTWAERSHGLPLFVFAALTMWPTTFLVVGLVAVAAVRGEIGLGAAITYAYAAVGVGTLLSRGNHDFVLAQGTDALPALLELERRTAAVAQPKRGAEDGTVVERGAEDGTRSAAELPRNEIRLEGVAFHYPGSEHAVFEGLDLSIEAGRSLAVVGANGAGKTTLVKLIARLYEPTAGQIEVDSIDLRELDPRGWQRRVSAIFQDFARYDLSARDNVAFGAVERAGDEAALIEAADRAGATEIIDSLPLGWETRLSRRYRNGAQISDGQWQRIALARALFAASAGAGVLVLDEPTAHLDARAEAELYDRFLEITQGLTTVIISHRFSTVRRADRIVVLEDGRVTEDGTHESLLAADGRYASMFRVQAARFTEEPTRA